MAITSDPHRFLEEVRGEEMLKIYVQPDISSLCSLKILSTILSKECVKHEAIFIEDKSNLELNGSKFVYLCHGKKGKRGETVKNYLVDSYSELICNENRIEFVKYSCECPNNNLDTLCNLFYLAKHLNYLDDNLLWVFLVPFSFYKIYLFWQYEDFIGVEEGESSSESSEGEELTNNICDCCSKIIENLNIEIKKKENDKEKVLVHRNGLAHPLTLFADLFHVLKNDIHFVIHKKLIYKKRKDIEDMKIKNYLAHKGISIKNSLELFTNLDHSTKKYLERNLISKKMYFKMERRAPVVSSIDLYFILHYFLFKSRTAEAYLALNQFNTLRDLKTVSFKDLVNFNFEIITQIKQSLAMPIKFNDTVLYKIKEMSCIRNIESHTRFVYDLTGVYMRAKHPDLKYLVVVEHKKDDFLYLYGIDVVINSLKVNGIVQIGKTEFYKIIMGEEID